MVTGSVNTAVNRITVVFSLLRIAGNILAALSKGLQKLSLCSIKLGILWEPPGPIYQSYQ